MTCTCPICLRTVDYPDKYVGKWSRCAGGCSTRMIVVPDGMGRSEDEVAVVWREEIRAAQISRAATVAAGVTLMLTPLADMFPLPVALVAVAFGMAVTLVGLRQADPPRPAGL